jgi:formylglycine-generating enzyme required for sulfatase activity
MRRELNPDFEEELDRVYRGGGWNSSARYARVANRLRLDPAFRYDFLGFRLAYDSTKGEQHEKEE